MTIHAVELGELVWSLVKGKVSLPEGWTLPDWSAKRTNEFLFAAITGQTIGAITVTRGRRAIVDGAARLVALTNAVLPSACDGVLPKWPSLARVAVRNMGSAAELYHPEPEIPISPEDFPVRASGGSIAFMQWSRRVSSETADRADAFCRWFNTEVPVIELSTNDRVTQVRERLNRHG